MNGVRKVRQTPIDHEWYVLFLFVCPFHEVFLCSVDTIQEIKWTNLLSSHNHNPLGKYALYVFSGLLSTYLHHQSIDQRFYWYVLYQSSSHFHNGFSTTP